MNESPPIDTERPTRILSDLHLAHPASRIETVESLRPLVAGADPIIFNGDTCEQSCAGWRGVAEARLDELKQLCAEEGAQAVFLPGNHDPEIAEGGWCELAGGRVFVTHGHAVYPTVAPWSHEYLHQRRAIRRIIKERSGSHNDLAQRWETTRTITGMLKPNRTRKLGRKGRNYLLSAVWPPGRCLNILRVWLTMVGQAQRFANRYCPEARVFLFGHFHRPGIWRRGDRTLCNTGAFMRGSRAYAADLREESLRVHPVMQSGGSFELGEGETSIRIPRE